MAIFPIYFKTFSVKRANTTAPHSSNLGIETVLIGATLDLAVISLLYIIVDQIYF